MARTDEEEHFAMDDQTLISRRAWLLRAKQSVIALAFVLTVIGVPVATALTSVENASAQGSNRVSFCAYLPGGTYAQNFNATLYQWTGYAWTAVRSGTSGSGCATFYQVPINSYYYVWVQSPSGVWYGASPSFYLTGAIQVGVGVHR